MNIKERNHKICEKFPILAMILCMLISNAIIQFAAVIPTILLKESTLSADTKDMIIDLAMIALALLFLLILKLWFRPNYEGTLKNHVSLKENMILLSVAVFFIIVFLFIVPIISGDFIFKPHFSYIILALYAGFAEEITFRAIPTAIGMKYLKNDESKVLLIFIITSVLFGLVHALNLMSGASVSLTIVQVLAAAGSGAYLCAILLRTGSVLPGVLFHSMVDFIAFSQTDESQEADIMAGDFNPWILVNLLGSIILAIIGLYLIRKAILPNIQKIWKDKWQES